MDTTLQATSPPPAPVDPLARLRQLRRRYRAEELGLQRALRWTVEQLDHWVRSFARRRDDRDAARAIDQVCEGLGDHARSLERDLVEVRSALEGLDLELDRAERADDRRITEVLIASDLAGPAARRAPASRAGAPTRSSWRHTAPPEPVGAASDPTPA